MQKEIIYKGKKIQKVNKVQYFDELGKYIIVEKYYKINNLNKKFLLLKDAKKYIDKIVK